MTEKQLQRSSPVSTGLAGLVVTLLLLRFFEASGKLRRALLVLRKRTGSHEETIREYQIRTEGIVIGRPLTEFQSVLTLVPTFVGARGDLLQGAHDVQS